MSSETVEHKGPNDLERFLASGHPDAEMVRQVIMVKDENIAELEKQVSELKAANRELLKTVYMNTSRASK